MKAEMKANLARDAARMSRREFLRAAALAGVAPSLAAAVFDEAGAQVPRKGGHLVVALAGGATTDVFDPALCTQDTCAAVNVMWGGTLVRESETASRCRSSPNRLSPPKKESAGASTSAAAWNSTTAKR